MSEGVIYSGVACWLVATVGVVLVIGMRSISPACRGSMSVYPM